MDDQERGQLLVEREKVQKEISACRTELHRAGAALRVIGDQLVDSTDSANFFGAPPDLSTFSPSFLRSRAISWDDFPTKESIAKLIQRLHGALDLQEKINDLLR